MISCLSPTEEIFALRHGYGIPDQTLRHGTWKETPIATIISVLE